MQGRVIYVTGGGSRTHRDPMCSALLRGQDKVADRGGTPELVEAIVTDAYTTLGREPCMICAEMDRVKLGLPADRSAKPPSRGGPAGVRVGGTSTGLSTPGRRY